MQAHPRRVAKVTRQIERELGNLLVTDKLLLEVTGSREGGNPLCSWSGVEVSGDLQVVKIYLSVMTDDIYEKKHIISRMQGLQKCALTSCLLFAPITTWVTASYIRNACTHQHSAVAALYQAAETCPCTSHYPILCRSSNA